MQSIEKVFANLKWVFVLALAVRLAVVIQGYEGDPQDSPEYEEIAHNILAGKGFVASYWWYGFELKSWRAPFYPFFLAGVYGVFGAEQWIVRIIQCGLGALTASFIVGIARRQNAIMASVCGGLAIFYGPMVSVSNEIMTETWFIFWLVAAAYCLLHDNRPGLMGGAAIGFAILTRPIGALLLVAWVVFACLRHRNWPDILGVCTVAVLVVLPWTIRNYYVHGSWPIISTQGGFVVAHSNALEPDWKKEIGWGTTREFLEEMPSEWDRDRYWWRQGLTFMAEHPLVYLRLVGERFVRMGYFFRPDYNFWWMLVLPFGCVGIWRDGLRGDNLFTTLFLGLSVLAFSCLLYGATRFRLPLEAFFLLFSASGFLYLADRWGREKMMRIGGALVAFHALVDWQDAWVRQSLLAVLRDIGMK